MCDVVSLCHYLYVFQLSQMRSYLDEQKLEMEKAHAVEVEDILEKVSTQVHRYTGTQVHRYTGTQV